MEAFCIYDAASNVRLRHGERHNIQLRNVWGNINLSFRSAYSDDGLQAAVPRRLVVEAVIEHIDFDTAVTTTGDIVRGMLNALCVAANAWIQDAAIRYAVERTSDSSLSRFYQQIPDKEGVLPRETRGIDVMPSFGFVRAMYDRPEEDPARQLLVRAAQQYSLMLQKWHPDTKALALMHAAIGAETLFELALQRMLGENAATREELADTIQETVFAKEVPRNRRKALKLSRLKNYVIANAIYHGDTECFEATTKASNGYEHGYGDYSEIKRIAEEHRDRAAAHLRRAIIDLSGADDADKAYLLSDRFQNPVESWPAITITGLLSDALPFSDRPPIDNLEPSLRECVYNQEADRYTLTIAGPAQVPRQVSNLEVKLKL